MTAWAHGMAHHATKHQAGIVSAVTAPPLPKSILASQHLARTPQTKKPSMAPLHNFARTPELQSPTHNKLHSPLPLAVHCSLRLLEVGDPTAIGTAPRGRHGLAKCLPLSVAHHQAGGQEATGATTGVDQVAMEDPVVTDLAATVVVHGEDHGEQKLAALPAPALPRGRRGPLDGDHSLLGLVFGLVARAQLPHHRLLL